MSVTRAASAQLPSTDSSEDTVTRNRYARGGVIGAAAAGVVFLCVLLDGKWSLLRSDPLGGFYDLQAHSLLRGHLNVPAAPLLTEAIFLHGKAYMYYGPWPAVLRMPIALFTHQFDGRLTQLSMLLAFTVAMVFTVRLTNRIRVLVRPDAPTTRSEEWAVGGFVFLVGAGSVFLFLASAAWVYHEAEIWGAALAIAAFDYIVGSIAAPNARNLATASALATLAFLSRASVGAGPVAALGLLFLASLWAPTRRLAGLPQKSAARRDAPRFALAVAAPLVLYASVNYAKFGTLFSVPLNRQILYTNAARRAALAANGNSLFGIKFVPTGLVQFLRPDAIRFTSVIPGVAFPAPAHVFFGAKFDTIDFSSGFTASMPALVVLAVIGLIGIARRPALAALRAPVVGATAAGGITLGIAFVAERYLSDFMPLLVLLGAAGLHLVLEWMPRISRSARRGLVVGFAALGVYSLWANAGLALLYQRALAPTYVTEPRLADFVRLQADIHRQFPGGSMPAVRRGPQLPRRPGRLESIFVVGECRAVYWSNGNAWLGLERTRASGYRRLRLTFAPAADDAWQPVLVVGPPGAGTFIAVRVEPNDRVVFGYYAQGLDRRWLESKPFRFAHGRASELDLVYDPAVGRVSAQLDGTKVIDFASVVRGSEKATVGRTDIGGPVAPRFSGRVTELPTSPTLCRALTR